jgi:pimeloyl-ACP methyl ester carboxylesterase
MKARRGECIDLVTPGVRAFRKAVTQLPLPSWLSEADLEVYAGEFARSGFRGPLNYYRNIDRNWELMAALAGIKVPVPALYIAGDHDLVVAFPGAAEDIANMKQHVPLLRDIQMLAGCGHWTQQERPAEVSAAITIRDPFTTQFTPMPRGKIVYLAASFRHSRKPTQ